MLVRSGGVDIIVIDSVAALVPKAEIEGEMGDQLPGPAGAADEPGAAQAHRQHQAREHARHLHQPDPDEDRRDVRQSRKPPPAATRSSSTRRCASTSAASARSRRARKSSATKRASRSSRTRSRRRSARRCSTSSTARASRAKARSSSSASRTDIVEKSGAWYAYNGDKIGQGKDNAREFLREHPGDRGRDRGEDPRRGRRAVRRARSAPAASRRRRVAADVRGARPMRAGRAARRRRPAAAARSRRRRCACSRAASTAAPSCAAAASRAASTRDEVDARARRARAARATCPTRATRSAVVAQQGRPLRQARDRARAEGAGRRTPTAAQDALRRWRAATSSRDAPALWQRRFGAPPRDEREKARQVRFLQARGYGLSAALQACCARPARDGGRSRDAIAG